MKGPKSPYSGRHLTEVSGKELRSWFYVAVGHKLGFLRSNQRLVTTDNLPGMEEMKMQALIYEAVTR